MGFLPDPVKVMLVSIGADHLVAGIRQRLGPFGQFWHRGDRMPYAPQDPSIGRGSGRYPPATLGDQSASPTKVHERT